MESFSGSLDHLLAELSRVDRAVRGAAMSAREHDRPPAGGAGGVPESSIIDAILETPVGRAPWPDALVASVEEAARANAARAEESARRGTVLRLAELARRFDLDPFEVDVILLALLPEVDVRRGRLMAYLNDDLARQRPSVDVALTLLCPTIAGRIAARERFAPDAPLLRHGLVQVIAEGPLRAPPLLACALRVEERIVRHLLGSDAVDPALAPFVRAVIPHPSALDDRARRLARFVASGPAPVVFLEGPRGAGKQRLVEAVSAELRIPLLVADAEALIPLLGDHPHPTPFRSLTREARLTGAAIHWENAGALLEEDGPARAAMLESLRDHEGPIFLGGSRAWHPRGALRNRPFLHVAVPARSAAEREAAWQSALGDRAAPGVELALLASAHRLGDEQIHSAARAALELARFRDPEGASLIAADLAAAARLELQHGLGPLARRIAPAGSWDDLVLPPKQTELLREICAHVRHRSRVYEAWGFEAKLALGKGLGALFSGPPGTGKTMAAGVIAAELGLELFHVDLSAVVSKYIGETEKHLARLFDDAESMGAILFFDEADSLFGKRTEAKDAHDRYANLQTSYLLQRIDAYEGMVILASNLPSNMDEAFVRRLRFVVEFPHPREPERRRIWERVLPAAMPRAADVDLGHLAQRLDVPGGPIRNIALAAAFLAAEEGAAVGMTHLLRAAKREYDKMGKLFDAREGEPR